MVRWTSHQRHIPVSYGRVHGHTTTPSLQLVQEINEYKGEGKGREGGGGGMDQIREDIKKRERDVGDRDIDCDVLYC